MGVIYKHKCKTTKLAYIGCTIFTMQSRLKEHYRSALREDGSYFQRALKKYGILDFESEILEEVNDEDLAEREIYWIEFYNTYNNGYNLTPGGLFGVINKDSRINAEESRQKTNINKYGGKSPSCSKEISNKRIDTMNKKQDNGMTIFEENGKKIAKALKGKVSVLNIKNNMKFISVLLEDYKSCWYLVGVSAKYIRYYTYNNNYYKSLDEVRLISGYIPKAGAGKTPYKEHKIDIYKIQNKFEEYNLFFNNFY